LALAGVAGEGIAVALPPPQPELATPAPVKTLAAAPARSKAQGTCDRITKPAPVSVPRPDYPLEARAAGIEGKVRIKLTVNELGEVVDATFVQRLGHGFDEAALNAALRARFEPARACGKATTATFTIAMRFSSG
jgi:TonB family protein